MTVLGYRKGMDAREAKMESDISHLMADMTDVRVSLRQTNKAVSDLRERMARVETKVDILPTKDFVVKTGLGAFAAFLTVTTFTTLYQGKLQQLVGLAIAK